MAPAPQKKGRLEVYIFLSFGLSRLVVYPRIVQSVEPYPSRWTHHVIIQSSDEVDEQLMRWIKEAHDSR